RARDGLPVAGPEHVRPGFGHVPRVGDVRRVMTALARRLGRLARDEAGRRRARDVQRARAVARLALHVGQALDVHDARAAGLLVARHAAADAVEVELLVVLLQRRVRARVRRLLPELVRGGVTGRALLAAHVARRAWRGLRRLAIGEGDAV